MTINANPASRKLARPFVLLAAALLAVTLAGVTARGALAGPKARYLSSARSLDLLRTAFGDVAERSFREPTVVVAPTSAATWALSDKVNMANNVWHPRSARPWASSDARAMWPEGMGGFTDPMTGDVYINAQLAVESAMPHEVLHANAAPEFLQTVGVALNEGVTQMLALDAMVASGVRIEKMPAYATFREIAGGIATVTGRDRLLGAYFNGGQQLADFVSAIGADNLARVKALAGTNDAAGAVQLLKGVGRAAA